MDSDEDAAFNFKSLTRKRISGGEDTYTDSVKTKRSRRKSTDADLDNISCKNPKGVVSKNKARKSGGRTNNPKVTSMNPNKSEEKFARPTQNTRSTHTGDDHVKYINSGSTERRHLHFDNYIDEQDQACTINKHCSIANGTVDKVSANMLNSSYKLRDKTHESSQDSSTGVQMFKDQRCPFCQVPFQALSLQSPNGHTMECMDIPLKASKECPAGLMCDNTIPSHYRRFRHSQLALCIAGLSEASSSQEDACSFTPQESCKQSDDNRHCHRSSSKEKSSQGSKNGVQKKKTASSKRILGSRKSGLGEIATCASSQPNSSQSEASQNSVCSSRSSIKAYFSPEKRHKYLGNAHKCDADKTGDWLFFTEPDNDNDSAGKLEDGAELKNGISQIRGGSQAKDLSKSFQSSQIEKGLEMMGGFLLDSCEEKKVPAASDVETECVEDEVQAQSDCEISSNVCISSVKLSDSLTAGSLNVTLSGSSVRKQTSLMSFFKPQCQSTKLSSNVQVKPVKVTKQAKDECVKLGAVPHLMRSASEPVKLLRIPSPSTLVSTKTDVDLSRNRFRGGKRNSEASDTGTESGNQKWSGRRCPFYKKIPGTAITVDAFCYGNVPGCQAYVLSHFHYDHYRGLTKRFSQPIYCSPVTANLIEKIIGVPGHLVNRLPLNKPCQVAGVELILMEANHCPGAVIILFTLPDGKKIVHTGDFRADTDMENYPPLQNISVDELYLDTTYCDPAYVFPPQRDTIQFAVNTALKAVEREPNTLVVCGAYTIGKERIFVALAEALHSKLCVQSSKKRILDCLDDNRLKSLISLRWTDGRVHVLPMGQLKAKGLETHLQQCPRFTSILAFEPTGWTHSNKALSLDTIRPKYSHNGVTIYGVPYSEHSSFSEMRRFVQVLRPKKILPTVNNGNPASRKKMEAIFRQWMSESESGINKTLQGSSRDGNQQSLGGWLKK